VNAAGLRMTGMRASAASCTQLISSYSLSVCRTSTLRPSLRPVERHSSTRSLNDTEP
jgi:hypothetical protein